MSSAVGSVSVVLAGRSQCPVVVVRGGAGPERAAMPVVVGVPDTQGDPGPLDFAAAAAEVRGVPLLIVTAWVLAGQRTMPAGAPGGAAQLARQQAARAARSGQAAEERVRRSHPQLSTRALVTELPPGTALAQASRGAALVVVGAPHRGEAEGSREESGAGDVVSDILGRSACPVIVVPGEESRSALRRAGSWRVPPA